MNSNEIGSYRDTQNANTGNDMALMFESMVHAMKKNSQQQMLSRLPLEVRKRIRALRKLQFQTTNLEAEFHRLVYELERKHQDSHSALFEKRNSIINGTYEPTEEECDYPDAVVPETQSSALIGSTTSDQANDQAASAIVNNAIGVLDNDAGIPDFWLNIFKYVPMFELMVKESDEPVLKHLTDIKVQIKPLPDMSFILDFYFSPNEYFENAVLSKEYLMKCEPDGEMPFTFDGPEIYNSRGCEILWKEGKNLTKRTIRHKGGLESGPPKTLKAETFFNFFNPPTLPDDVNHKDYDTINNLLETDFEIGHYLKERIVPRAVLYFTGENDDDFESDASISSDSEDFDVSEEGEEESDVVAGEGGGNQ